MIEAYFEFNYLKQLYRRGWLRRGILKERCESVAGHTFAVAVLAYWLAGADYPELDAGRVIRLALQASVYAYQGALGPAEFLASAGQGISDARLREVLDTLLAIR